MQFRTSLGWLLLLIPVSLALAYLGQSSPLWMSASTVLAFFPLAEWIRRATVRLAHRLGSAIRARNGILPGVEINSGDTEHLLRCSVPG